MSPVLCHRSMHDMEELPSAPAAKLCTQALVPQRTTSALMASGLPTLTIAGAAGVGKRSIAACLLGLADAQEGSLPSTWHLDTRYYTANVQINVAAVSHDEPCNSGQLADSEALLLVFDVTKEESMHSLQRWLEGFDGDLPEVCLMLANRMDLLAVDSSASEGWHEQAQDWCCQNLFEYIEVSAMNPDVDASLSRDGDRQGIRRVVSALQAHIWPGLCMKPRTGALGIGTGMGQGNEDVSTAVSHATQPRFHSSAAAALEHSPRHSPAAAAGAQPALSEEQMGAWQAASPENSSAAEPLANQQQHPADASTEDPQLNGVASDPEPNGPLEGSDSEGDGGLDEFESMMRRLRHGRDHLQGLPDEERRARAASMAVQMMQGLALLHSDDSESEGGT